MPNALRYLAIAANVVFLLGIIVLFLDDRPYRALEFFYYFLAFAYPVINLFALCTGPDREERLLRRQVNKAELRKRLKELGEG